MKIKQIYRHKLPDHIINSNLSVIECRFMDNRTTFLVLDPNGVAPVRQTDNINEATVPSSVISMLIQKNANPIDVFFTTYKPLDGTVRYVKEAYKESNVIIHTSKGSSLKKIYSLKPIVERQHRVLRDKLKCCLCGLYHDTITSTFVTQHQNYICPTCYAERMYTCAKCGVSFLKPTDDNKCTLDGEHLCTTCFKDLVITCRDCGTYHNALKCKLLGGIYICSNCESKYVSCDRCNNLFHSDKVSLYESTNQILCNHCISFYDKARDIVVLDSKRTNCKTRLTYGIELETASGEWKKVFPQSPMNSMFRVAFDRTVTGHEYCSPILSGDEGFRYISNFLHTIPGHYVDHKCGYHVHFGVTFNDTQSLFKILYTFKKLQDYMFNLVPVARRTNRYCLPLPERFGKYKEADFNKLLYDTVEKINGDKLDKYANGKKGRYFWINLHSYFYRRTIEIRNHEGTLSYDDITNWINLNGKILEFAIDSGFIQLIRRLRNIKDMDSFFKFIGEIVDKKTADFYRDKYNILYRDFSIPEKLVKYYKSTTKEVVNTNPFFKDTYYNVCKGLEEILSTVFVSEKSMLAHSRLEGNCMIASKYDFVPTIDSWYEGKDIPAYINSTTELAEEEEDEDYEDEEEQPEEYLSPLEMSIPTHQPVSYSGDLPVESTPSFSQEVNNSMNIRYGLHTQNLSSSSSFVYGTDRFYNVDSSSTSTDREAE